MRHVSKHVCHLGAQFPLSGQNSIDPSRAHSWHSPSGCSGWAGVLEKMCTFQHSGGTPACWGVFLKCQPPAFPGPNQGHVQLPYPGIQGNRTHISTCRWCLLGPINLTLPYWKQVSDPCLPMDHLFWRLWQSSLLDLVNSWHSCQGKAKISIFMILFIFTHLCGYFKVYFTINNFSQWLLTFLENTAMTWGQRKYTEGQIQSVLWLLR